MRWEPVYSKTVLDNGITVISEEIGHIRSVSIGIWVQCGSRQEGALTKGAAHFIEHMLFKGTHERSAFDIVSAIDSVGGVMNASTGKEITSFYIKIPDYHLALAIELLADMISNSRFDDVEICKEKSVVLQEIQLLEDTPDEYIHDFFDAAFWNGHPLGSPILGTKDCIEGLSRDALIDFFQTRYRGESLVVSAAGNLRHDILVNLVQKSFGSLSKKAVKERSPLPVVKSTVAMLQKDLEQAHMIVGSLGPSAVSAKRFTGFVLNAVLGGSMSSRLFQEIREKRGLAYTIHSYLVPYRDTGMVGIYVGTGEQTVGEVIRLIQGIVTGLCNDRLTPREVQTAKELIKGNFLLSMESSDNRMSRLARNEICFGRHVPEEEVIAEIDAVSEEDVRDLACEIFRPATMSIAAMGRISEKDVTQAWRYL